MLCADNARGSVTGTVPADDLLLNDLPPGVSTIWRLRSSLSCIDGLKPIDSSCGYICDTKMDVDAKLRGGDDGLDPDGVVSPDIVP